MDDKEKRKLEREKRKQEKAERHAKMEAEWRERAKKSVADGMRLGIKVGIWMHIPGPETSCPGHKEWDGRPFLLTEGLYDEGRGKNVLPGIEVGCTCSYRSWMPEFGDKPTPEIEELLKRAENS